MKKQISFLALAITFIVISFALQSCAPAQAAQNDTDRTSWSKWQEYTLTDCSDDSINSAVVCGGTRGLRVEGYDSLTLDIKYTKSAGTGWSFDLEYCDEGQATTDCTDATDWGRVPIESVGLTAIDLALSTITHTASASDRLGWTVGIKYKRIRLNNFVASGSPDANDKITVIAKVVAVDSF